MFQCNKIILGVKGHRENHWSVEIICTANVRHVLHSSNRLVQSLKVPLNQCALRALSRVATIFTYIEIAALRGFSALCERVRVRCVKKSLHHESSICICVFFFLLWSVSGRMSRSPPKRGRPPRNEKNKTILLRESTLKPKEMLLLFINECQLNF